MAFMKTMPVFSQCVSLSQLIGGDEEGAKETQLQFSRRCPFVSQARSFVEAALGDYPAARATQDEFSRTCPGISQARSFIEAVFLWDATAALRTQEGFLQANVWEGQRRIAASGTPDRGLMHADLQEVEDSELFEETMCVICLERPKVCTLVHGDTGHLCCCTACAQVIRQRGDHCPMCRMPVDHVIRQY